jgi:hypothetical protein
VAAAEGRGEGARVVVVSGCGACSAAGAADSCASWRALGLADGEAAAKADDESGTGLRVTCAGDADAATAAG